MSVEGMANSRCDIFSVTTTKNIYGANTETYTIKYSNIPVRIRYMTGREDRIDGKFQNPAIYRLYIPKQLNIIATDQIIDTKGRRYDILYVNRTDRKRHLQIECKRIESIVYHSSSSSSSSSSNSSSSYSSSSYSSNSSSSNSSSSNSSSSNSSSSESSSSNFSSSYSSLSSESSSSYSSDSSQSSNSSSSRSSNSSSSNSSSSYSSLSSDSSLSYSSDSSLSSDSSNSSDSSDSSSSYSSDSSSSYSSLSSNSSSSYSSLSSNSSSSYSSLSSNSSSSSESQQAACPNDFSNITGTLVNRNMLQYTKLCVKVNGGTENKYVYIYNGDTSALTSDIANPLFGLESSSNLTSSMIVDVFVNGTNYYLRVYTGDTQTDCCSNIVGTEYTTGNYTSAGYVMVSVNGNDRFIHLYNKNT